MTFALLLSPSLSCGVMPYVCACVCVCVVAQSVWQRLGARDRAADAQGRGGGGGGRERRHFPLHDVLHPNLRRKGKKSSKSRIYLDASKYPGLELVIACVAQNETRRGTHTQKRAITHIRTPQKPTPAQKHKRKTNERKTNERKQTKENKRKTKTRKQRRLGRHTARHVHVHVCVCVCLRRVRVCVLVGVQVRDLLNPTSLVAGGLKVSDHAYFGPYTEAVNIPFDPVASPEEFRYGTGRRGKLKQTQPTNQARKCNPHFLTRHFFFPLHFNRFFPHRHRHRHPVASAANWWRRVCMRMQCMRCSSTTRPRTRTSCCRSTCSKSTHRASQPRGSPR